MKIVACLGLRVIKITLTYQIAIVSRIFASRRGSCSLKQVFETNSWPPLFLAAFRSSGVMVCAVIKITRVRGNLLRRTKTASKPLIPGIARSIKTRSGRSLSTSISPSRAFSAVAITRIEGSSSKNELIV
jgi:hypothetical protein